MEGKPVSNLILDTGATRTLVRSNLLPPSIRIEGEITVRCAHGDTLTYPLADIKVSIGSKTFLVRAGISNTLPVPIILGRDIPELLSLINDESGTTLPNTEDAFLVTTCAQKKQQQEAEQAPQGKEEGAGAIAKPLEAHTEPLCEPFVDLDDCRQEDMLKKGETPNGRMLTTQTRQFCRRRRKEECEDMASQGIT